MGALCYPSPRRVITWPVRIPRNHKGATAHVQEAFAPPHAITWMSFPLVFINFQAFTASEIFSVNPRRNLSDAGLLCSSTVSSAWLLMVLRFTFPRLVEAILECIRQMSNQELEYSWKYSINGLPLQLVKQSIKCSNYII